MLSTAKGAAPWRDYYFQGAGGWVERLPLRTQCAIISVTGYSLKDTALLLLRAHLEARKDINFRRIPVSVGLMQRIRLRNYVLGTIRNDTCSTAIGPTLHYIFNCCNKKRGINRQVAYLHLLIL